MELKLEEIREGIYRIIIKHDYSSLEQFDWERDLVGQITDYLHSQGVVIESKEEAIFHHGYFPTVEPLIEGKE